MIVFVEGVDGSGKSTLINQLSEYFTTVRVPKNQKDQLRIWLNLIDMSKTYDIITDRCPISDYVYRMADGGNSEFTMMELLSIIHAGTVIWCKSSDSFEDSIKRGEDYVKTRLFHNTVSDCYNYLMKILKQEGVKVIEYCWQFHDFNDLLKEVRLNGSDSI